MTLQVGVFDATGQTMLAVLENASAVQFLDEKNGPGSGSFTVDADDAKATKGNLAFGNVVKIGPEGVWRQACRLASRRHRVVADRGQRSIDCSGPGLAGILESGIVYPQGGFSSSASTDRWFNFAADAGVWYDAADWVAATAANPGSYPADFPQGWPDSGSKLLWSADPFNTGADGTYRECLFRGSFSVASSQQVRVFATANDFFELFLDGQQILSQTSQLYQWRNTFSYDVTLPAGDHLLAARAWDSIGTQSFFMAAVSALDADGNPTTTLFRSDSSWLVHQVAPNGSQVGWAAGQILYTLFEEAAARNCFLTHLTPTFTGAVDSAGRAWSGIVDRSFPIGTDLLQVAQELAHDSLDFKVNPDMSFDVWNQARP